MKYAFFLLTAVVSLNASSLFADDGDETKNEPTTQTESTCEEGHDCADEQE